MGARFDKLETNQISQGAGLTQSSGREKVTVLPKECQMKDCDQLLHIYTEITSNAGRWLREGQ